MYRPLIALGAVITCIAAAPAAPVVVPGSWWEIIAIDGRALEPSDPRAQPYVAFMRRSYSVNAGCNGLGGLYAQHGGRLYALPGPQTQMFCGGRRGEQEAAVNAVFAAAPVVAGAGERITISAQGRTLALRRIAPRRPYSELPEAWQGTRLAGQSYDLSRIDGAALSRQPFPRLSFAARTATLQGLGGQLRTMAYRQSGDSVTFGGKPGGAGDILSGRTFALVSGPNGEILLAGGGHWLAGDNRRRDRPK
jgi:heat shock protein HslJ